MFLVRSPWGECVPCQVIYVLSGPIGWQVLDIFKTSNGRQVGKVSTNFAAAKNGKVGSNFAAV